MNDTFERDPKIGPVGISDIELASRLSFFLWSSTPDDQLLRVAEAGRLHFPAVKPDPKKFPDWGPELKEDMRTETRMFFDTIVRENRPVSDFIDAHYSFLNERLAKHYGIDGVTGAEFRRVALATDQRSGVLTLLTSLYGPTSYFAATSIWRATALA